MDKTNENYKYSLSALVEVFSILEKYAPDETCPLCAEHDEIWAGLTIQKDKVSQEDIDRLSELGWKVNDEGGFHHYV